MHSIAVCWTSVTTYIIICIFLQESTPPKILTGNLNWKLIEMPTGVMGAQAVVIGGKVYIGGGFAEGNDYKILEYTVQGGYWREMKTPVSYYGLAAVNGQVMITGGVDKKDEATNQVWVLDSLSDTWIQPFPPLPATRKATSAVNYKKWVLVAGGKDVTACSELYILDSASKVWYNALPLPTAHGAYNPSLAVMHDTLYVAWGFTAVSISIPALISDAVSQYPATSGLKWNPLPNLSTKQPTLVVFHGALLTVGTVSHPPSSTIAMYCPQTEQWLTVAQLPTPRRACTCVTLPDTEELMVIGGSNINMGVIKTIALCTL